MHGTSKDRFISGLIYITDVSIGLENVSDFFFFLFFFWFQLFISVGEPTRVSAGCDESQ